jgi:hypothetical protein
MPAEALTDDDAESMLEEGDGLTSVIRGHLRTDFLLNTAIEAALDDPDEAGLDGLPFPRKVDLAVAMGIIPKDVAATCKALNRIRNRFAHDPDYQLDAAIASQVRASFPEALRGERYPWPTEDETPRLVAKRGFLTAFVTLQQAIEQVRDSKAADRAFREAIVAVADHTLPKGMTPSDFVREAVEADRQRRASEGRL